MIDENASYIGASITDTAALSAYEIIGEQLREQETKDEFMDTITTTLTVVPTLIKLENILYIIDDRHVRPTSLVGISGREMLEYELDLQSQFDDFPEALIDFYREKYNFSDDEGSPYEKDEDLLSTLWTLRHAYYLCHSLREYVSNINKMKYHFLKSMKATSQKEEPGTPKCDKGGSDDNDGSDHNVDSEKSSDTIPGGF